VAILTAKDFKQRETPDIVVPVGPDVEVRCRVPDLAALLFTQLLPMELTQHVIESTLQMEGLDQEAKGKKALSDPEFLKFLEHWICAVCVEPRVTMQVPDEKARILAAIAALRGAAPRLGDDTAAAVEAIDVLEAVFNQAIAQRKFEAGTDDAVWIGDVSIMTRLAIFNATFRGFKAPQGAREFLVRAARAATGPDSPSVAMPPVGAGGSDEPTPGA
jgi:hypothetical protein